MLKTCQLQLRSQRLAQFWFRLKSCSAFFYCTFICCGGKLELLKVVLELSCSAVSSTCLLDIFWAPRVENEVEAEEDSNLWWSRFFSCMLPDFASFYLTFERTRTSKPLLTSLGCRHGHLSSFLLPTRNPILFVNCKLHAALDWVTVTFKFVDQGARFRLWGRILIRFNAAVSILL